ncbi:MAG: alpha/beta fold hydrolase [Methyloligellaceae bacterium]
MTTFEESGPVRLSAIEAGSGEPVVLLHGSASSNRQWRGLIEALYDRYHVIAPDLIGYGETPSWPYGEHVGMADHARLLADLVKRQGARLHIVGHSFGGAVALRFAQEHPERVQSLTLIEPVALHVLAGEHSEHRALLDDIRSVAAQMRRAEAEGDADGGVQHFVAFWNGQAAWKSMRADLRTELASCSRAIIGDFDAIADETPGVAGFRGIEAPTLLLYGTRSPQVTIRISKMLAETMPNAAARGIDGAGHMSPLSHGATVNGLVAAHIARHRAAWTVTSMSSPSKKRLPDARPTSSSPGSTAGSA